ncbi:MAG TPA: glycosyltransferase [Chthoniobacterales bacterium]|nr:glycosyltransferase [Chthoniobacterales bacterium]
MVTVVIPSFDRPEMLRTALRSIAQQTALDEIGCVLVSETVLESRTEALCNEFPALPIRYVQRDRLLKPVEHIELLFREALALPNEFVAMLHDDDWWAPLHIAAGVEQLQQNPDATAYWAAAFMVEGERSWISHIWNVTAWIAAEYPPLDSVVKMDRKTAALTCVNSGPGAYASLIGPKEVLAETFAALAESANPHDHDRLFFLELAKRGPVLVNLTPQVYVRAHPARDQHTMGEDQAARHIAAATEQVLDLCAELGVDVEREWEHRCETFPMIGSGAALLASTMDPRVRPVLLRRGVVPEAIRVIIDPPPPPAPPPPPPPLPQAPDALVKKAARWIIPWQVWETAKAWKAARANSMLQAKRPKSRAGDPSASPRAIDLTQRERADARPFFSIICPTFNCAQKIGKTLESILCQPGVELECIVSDAASTDGTLQVIKSFSWDKRLRYDSRPDEGIYHGMNRGLAAARGRFLYFIGAGDTLRPKVLAEVAHAAQLERIDSPTLIYGDVFWEEHGWVYAGEFNRFDLATHNICQQAIFYHRSIFDLLGPFDPSYRWHADYVLNLRCFGSEKIAKRYLPIIIATYEGAGASSRRWDAGFASEFARLVREELGICAALYHRWKFHGLANVREALGRAVFRGIRRRIVPAGR